MMDKSTILQKTIVVWFGAMICCALWGSAFPFIKLGYGYMNIAATDTSSQILYAGVRFTLAGILTILIGSILQRKFLLPSAEALPKVFSLSLFQTVLQYLFFYIGLANASGVNASIIEGTNVFVALLIAGLIFKLEKLSAQKIIGCVIGFAGVVIINLAGGSVSSMSFTGEGFIFISTIAYAFSSVIMKRYSKTENPVMLSGYQFLSGGIIMVIVGKLFGGDLSKPLDLGHGMAILIWLSIISAVAYSIWGILLKYNPVSKVAVFGFMNPIFGVVLSALLLKEGDFLNVSSVAALLLVCVGIYVCNRQAE